MKTGKWISGAVVTFLFFTSIAFAGDFDFLRELDRKAREDHKAFVEHMSLAFGLPVPRIDKIIVQIGSPSDAFMVLKIGKLSDRSYDEVFREYETNRGKGWGVIAKNMGIKPGSAEFHELKKGGKDDFHGSSSKGKGKSGKKGKHK